MDATKIRSSKVGRVLSLRLMAKVLAVAILSHSAVCMAQFPTTVGELLDRGGKKLLKEDLSKLVSNSTIKGTSFRSTQWVREYTFAVDGSLSGTAVSPGRPLQQMYGDWKINDSSQLCIYRKSVAAERGSDYCGSYFRWDNYYFESAADDRASPLFLREIKRGTER